MKTVIAIDSLKGSLSSLEAGDAIRTAICRVQQNADVVIRPLADGGEGTVEALTHGMGGALQTVSVTGPLGEPVRAVYGIVRGDTAVIEMSAAAGLTLVDAAKRNPLYTTTYGVGELIRHAIGQGCRRFIVGIGGSATNDGGVGMLQALATACSIMRDGRSPLALWASKSWQRLRRMKYCRNCVTALSALPVT